MGLEVSFTNAEFELLAQIDGDITVHDAYQRLRGVIGFNRGLATVYGLFAALRSKGLIVEIGCQKNTHGRPTKIYAITPIGQTAVSLYQDITTWQTMQVTVDDPVIGKNSKEIA